MKSLFKMREFFSVFTIRLALLILFFSFVPNTSWAFKISPCLRVLTVEDNFLSQEPVRRISRCTSLEEGLKSAVHEHMLLSSILEYNNNADLELNDRGWKYQYMVSKKWGGGKQHQSYALMYGVWWNDDPMMSMLFQGWSFISGASRFNTNVSYGKEYYPSRLKECKVEAKKHLGHESHYGSLQHLHFMTDLIQSESTPQLRVDWTTNNALKWMKFAYSVAIGEYKPEDPLTWDMGIGFNLDYIAQNVCASTGSLKVMSLFTPTHGILKNERIEITPDVALGSMIHVIQDSWSSSHTCRVEQSGSSGELPLAVLTDVYNYNDQHKLPNGEANHALQDLYPKWLNNQIVQKQKLYSNGPIEVTTWLLNAVDKDYPWDEVEEYLRTTIFAKSDPNKTTNNQICLFSRTSQCNSRLTGMYFFEDRASADRVGNWGGHFTAENLAELAFHPTSPITRVDSNWITYAPRDDDWNLTDLTWAHLYWSGVPHPDHEPLWELIAQGRAIVCGTELRINAYNNLYDRFPEAVSILEMGRLAAMLGSDLGSISPWMIREDEDNLIIQFHIDMRDAENDEYLARLRAYEGPKNHRDLAVGGDSFGVPYFDVIKVHANVSEAFLESVHRNV